MRTLLSAKPTLRALCFAKWLLIALLLGTAVGAVGGAFGLAVAWTDRLGNAHPWTLYLAPVAGLGIAFLYRLACQENNRGADTLLDAARGSGDLSAAIVPLIAGSTLLSHLVSASVGREGAALQLGGGMASALGKAARLRQRDRRVCVLCGMGAGFAALFGTPLTACLFALEVLQVGALRLEALLPCMGAAFVAAGVSGAMGVAPDCFPVAAMALQWGPAALAVGLGGLCALTGMLMCAAFHQSAALFKRLCANPYLRAGVGGLVFVGCTLLAGNRDYTGGGLALIERCFRGEGVMPLAFLLKILFTALAVGAGFKGGEIVPTLCVGATLGALFATLTGLPAPLCAAMGMVGLFAAATHCPLAALALACELFGFGAMPYFALAVAASCALSGKIGLYHAQRFSCGFLPLQEPEAASAVTTTTAL